MAERAYRWEDHSGLGDETHIARHKSIATLLNDLKGQEVDEDEEQQAARHTWTPPSKYRAGQNKRDRKAQKSMKKACKNQQRHTLDLLKSQVDAVSRNVHGPVFNIDGRGGFPSEVISTDKATLFERREAFLAQIEDYQATLSRNVRESRSKTDKSGKAKGRNSIGSDESEEAASGVMVVMGVIEFGTDGTQRPVLPANDQLSKRQRSILLSRLKSEIAEDIAKYHNEILERSARMDGYWRYASRGVLERLAGNALRIDRATGAMLHDDEGEEVGAEAEGVGVAQQHEPDEAEYDTEERGVDHDDVDLDN